RGTGGAMGTYLESRRRRASPRRGSVYCARARHWADEGPWAAKESDVRLGDKYARRAARPRARFAARGGLERGLSRRRDRVQGEACSAIQRKLVSDEKQGT